MLKVTVLDSIVDGRATAEGKIATSVGRELNYHLTVRAVTVRLSFNSEIICSARRAVNFDNPRELAVESAAVDCLRQLEDLVGSARVQMERLGMLEE